MRGFWYLAKGDQAIGPLTFAQLADSIAKLQNPHQALVWNAGLDGWQTVQNVPDLCNALSDKRPQFPLANEFSVERRRAVGPEVNELSTTKSPSVAWTKTARAFLTITVILVSFTVARHLTRSSPLAAEKTDLTTPISGSAKDAFVSSARSACLKKQKASSDNIALKLSSETITSYCSCYTNALAGLVTFGDLSRYPRDGAIPPEMQKKIDQASAACWESMQRKLMGADEK
jgi:hypothetical protein